MDVLFGCGGLDLEGDRSACRVGEAQDLGDFVGEGAYSQWNVSHVVASRTGYLASSRWRDGVDVRLKPSSAGESSTDMVWLILGRSLGKARVVGCWWEWAVLSVEGRGVCCCTVLCCAVYGNWCVRASKRRGNDCWSGLGNKDRMSWVHEGEETPSMFGIEELVS